MPVTDASSHRERVYWTEDEDKKLLEMIEIHGSSRGKDSKWPLIAAELEGRNIKDCRKRFFHSLAPDLKKGRWSTEEDQLLLEWLDKLGPVWYKIAQQIPGRKDDQCAKRYKEVLDPSLSKKLPWSDEEDKLLATLYQELGGKWQQIAKSLPGRTGLCCRNRWRKFKSEAEDRTNKGGNAGGTKKLEEGGRARLKSSEEDDVSAEAGSSTGTGTKAAATKKKGSKKRTITEVATTSSERDSPRKRALTEPGSISANTGLIDPPSSSIPASSSHDGMDILHHMHSSHLNPHMNPHANGHPDTFSLPHTSQFASGLPHLRSTSPPHPPPPPSHAQHPSYYPPYPPNASYDSYMDSALHRPPTYLSMSRSSDAYSHPSPSINESIHPSTDFHRPAQFLDGNTRMTPFDSHRSDLSQALLQSAMSNNSVHNNTDDHFNHLQSEHAQIPSLHQPSQPSPRNLSSNSPYSSSLAGTSPATTSTPGTNNGGSSSLKSSTHASAESEPQGLPPSTDMPSSNNHTNQNSLPSSHVNHQVETDDNSWISSFLAGLHNPSASIPPTALNSPVFTGGWEPALFSAPPSPVRQKYQSVINSNMNGQYQYPEHPLIPASQFLNHPKLSEHVDDPSARNYKPAPTSPLSMPPPALPPHILQNQQQQQHQHQSQSHDHSSLPTSAIPHLSLPSQANQPAPPGSAASFLHQHNDVSSRPSASSASPADAVVPSSASSTSVHSGSQLPLSALNHAMPSPQSQPHHHQQQQHPSPRPNNHNAAQHHDQMQNQQYMIWDPRPASETFKGPLVLVPAEILAGLIQKANENGIR